MSKISMIYGDVLEVKSGLLVHGVNCQGVFNAGIAKQIRQKYPDVYQEYMENFKIDRESFIDGYKHLLGHVQYCRINEDYCIVNAFTQEYYGNDGRKYLSYDAIDEAFLKISKLKNKETYIRFPKIGCGLAGGEWPVVESIIEHRLKDFPNKFLWIND